MPVKGAFAVPHPPLIIPDVGRGEEKKIAATVDAYEAAMKQAAQLSPDTVVLVTPHSVMYGDYLHISPGEGAEGSFARFGAPQVKVSVRYDSVFARALADMAERNEVPAGFLGERDKSLDHGSLIPLYFLRKYMPDIAAVRLSISGLSFAEHYKVGRYIAQVADEQGKNVVVIASGDLSHRLKEDGPYGFAPEGPEFDKQVTRAFETGDFLSLMRMDEDTCEGAGECGLRAFIVMAGALDGRAVDARLLSYEGPFGVGYAVAGFIPGAPDESRRFLVRLEAEERGMLAQRKANEDEYVRLARYSLEHYIKTGKEAALPADVSSELTGRRAGVFVSLKKDGRLRGCIGTIAPTQPSMAMEILHNAVSAGTQDSRFSPVQKSELPSLVYSVDVLGDAEDISGMDELDVKRYGVIVSSGYRRGLLLPDLAGVDTPQQQVEIALQKAGISQNETYSLQRFEVVRHT